MTTYGQSRSNSSALAKAVSMHVYPADERWISEVERGHRCEGVVPLLDDVPFLPGEIVVFALAISRPGESPNYVKAGDSVRVLLTDVITMPEFHPITGQSLIQLTWEPPRPEPIA